MMRLRFIATVTLALGLGGVTLTRAQMASTKGVVNPIANGKTKPKIVLPIADDKTKLTEKAATTPAPKPTPAPVLPPDSVRDLLLLQRQVLRQAVTIQSLLAQIKETDLYKQYDDASQKQLLTQRALTDRTTAILSSLALDPQKYEIDLDTFAIREKATAAPPTPPKK